jgi:hypothetical protein
MKKRYYSGVLVTVVALAAMLTACGSDNNTTNSLAPFSPEIVNNQDAFQFQVTDAENVTTTVSYTWQNTGTQATVNQSSTVTGGTVTVTLFDADSTQVYTSGLLASATEQSSVGTAGAWTVVVTLTNGSGTLNFRAEKL